MSEKGGGASNPLHDQQPQPPPHQRQPGEVKAVSRDEAYRKQFLNQVDVPWEKVESRFNPTFMMCDGKIVKYDSKGLAIWRVS